MITLTPTVIAEGEFLGWLGQARPGDAVVYHRGFLVVDRADQLGALSEQQRITLNAIADRALALAAMGVLQLVQRRHGPCDYSYLAITSNRRAK